LLPPFFTRGYGRPFYRRHRPALGALGTLSIQHVFAMFEIIASSGPGVLGVNPNRAQKLEITTVKKLRMAIFFPLLF
jgi:hypothetical protein